MVEVNDEDKRAAIQHSGLKRWSDACIIHGGLEMQTLVQAFARHRIAAYQRGKIEGARLAIEAAVREARDRADADDIRALSPAKIVGEG